MLDSDAKFEKEIGGLEPRELSPDLEQQILADLEDQPRTTTSRTTTPRTRRLVWASIAAIAAGIVVALITWPTTDEPRELADAWTITPVGAPRFDVLGPDRIRLTSGELHIQSVSPQADWRLTVETDAGEVHAAGTEFYVGALKKTEKGNDMHLTRVLILAGTVTLTNTLGSIVGEQHDLLAAEEEAAPTKVVVQANNRFAFDLYQQLSKQNGDGNLFFSPYSIKAALAMLAEAARGQTALEIGNVLRLPNEARRVGDDAQHIPWKTALLHTGMSELNQQLTPDPANDPETKKLQERVAKLEAEREAFRTWMKETEEKFKDREPPENEKEVLIKEFDKRSERDEEIVDELNELYPQIVEYELSIANALWCDRTFPLRKEYLDVLKEAHGADAFDVDFRGNSEAERDRINAWVEKQTKERIRDILSPGTVDASTKLVLANAIYFKGSWLHPFVERYTRDRDFTLLDGSTITVKMMKLIGKKLRYAELSPEGDRVDYVYNRDTRKWTKEPNDDGLQLVELPYQGDRLSMILVLPKQPDGLTDLQTQLDAETLDSWINQMRRDETHVWMPRWRMDTTYDLPQTLAALGMPSAFQPGGFTGLSDSDKAEDVFLAAVVHKGFIEVNEKGTEVAVSTAAAAKDEEESRPTPLVRADHPFLFIIRDNPTGHILFMGRLTQP